MCTIWLQKRTMGMTLTFQRSRAKERRRFLCLKILVPRILRRMISQSQQFSIKGTKKTMNKTSTHMQSWFMTRRSKVLDLCQFRVIIGLTRSSKVVQDLLVVVILIQAAAIRLWISQLTRTMKVKQLKRIWAKEKKNNLKINLDSISSNQPLNVA